MKKFQPNAKIAEARDRLYGLFTEKDRGALIQHEEIEKSIGFVRKDIKGTYYRVVQLAAKKHQEERGVSILNEPLVGYFLATAEQQLKILADKTRRGRRQIIRGYQAVEAIPDDHATDHQRRLRDALVERGRQEAADLLQANRLNEYLMRAKPGDPLKIRVKKEEAG